MKDRFGREPFVGSDVAIASRKGSCCAELKIRRIIEMAADGTAYYRTPNGRREKLINDTDRWIVLG